MVQDFHPIVLEEILAHHKNILEVCRILIREGMEDCARFLVKKVERNLSTLSNHS